MHFNPNPLVNSYLPISLIAQIFSDVGKGFLTLEILLDRESLVSPPKELPEASSEDEVASVWPI